MEDSKKIISELYKETESDAGVINNSNVAHFIVNFNKVISMQSVEGLSIDVDELEDGIKARVNIEPDTIIEKPVHICFGMMHNRGRQNIIMDVEIGDNSHISILAHCVFPSGKEITHVMDARINIGKNALYSYLEKHVHGDTGGVEVYPKAKVTVDEGGRFFTEFNLIKGRVGVIDMEYETFCRKNAVLEMNAKISGKEDDVIKISEIGHLEEGARGALTSNIAVKGNARSEVYNKLRATGAYAKGHVDCKEIVLENASASAIPVVEVLNSKAHITHEAAIGSVDKKQLETLMARGLSEEEASDLIIQGMLSPHRRG